MCYKLMIVDKLIMFFTAKVVTVSGKMIRRHAVASYGGNQSNLHPTFMLGRRQMDTSIVCARCMNCIAVSRSLQLHFLVLSIL